MRPQTPFSLRSRRRRSVTATLLIGAAFVFLGAAFFRTQVVRNHDFVLRAEENRIRVIPVPAPRGPVFDRNGQPIAETLTRHSLYLEPTSVDSARVALRLIQSTLGMSDEDIDGFVNQLEGGLNEPLLLARSLSFEQLSFVEEHRTDLPVLTVEPFLQRHYASGEAVAHLIGYVGEISRAELEDSINWAGYSMGQVVGRVGIEREYEPVLGGRQGERYVEVDVRGRVVGTIAPRAAQPPTPGRGIKLTIDLELQQFIHSIFPRDRSGAVVAMAPSTGEVLALYSHPTYDPNALVGGIDSGLWSQLSSDPDRPLLNRATSGVYPPGSTWKLATAIVGLEKGVIQSDTQMPIACTGGMTYAGRYSRCWRPEGHGTLDLVDAIANSCNVYFYQLGIWLGLNQLALEGTRLGFSRRTGIDLPTESAGTFPADTVWYRNRFGWDPTPSEVMSLAIGQGPNSQTPLRIAQFFAALAGDGTAQQPRLLLDPDAPTPVETDLGLRRETREALRVGLARAMEEGGSAYLSSLERWKMYGKTGSSQNNEDPTLAHAWFAGFAGPPEGDPEIVVAAIIELGESGSSAAAPIAAKLADFYLNSKHGYETNRLQTLGERLQGVPFDSD